MHPFWIKTFTDIKTIISVPFTNPELLWQIAPIFFLWLLMEFYFGTHKKEKLGWNTALGNGISLFWIIVSSMQYMFANYETAFSWDRFIVILLITIYAIFISVISFKHTFSSKVTYILSSPTPVYFFAFSAMIYAFGVINAKLSTLMALFIIYASILLFSFILKKLLPEGKEDEDEDDFSSSMDKNESNFDFSTPSTEGFNTPDLTSTTAPDNVNTSQNNYNNKDYSNFKF